MLFFYFLGGFLSKSKQVVVVLGKMAKTRPLVSQELFDGADRSSFRPEDGMAGCGFPAFGDFEWFVGCLCIL